MSIKKVVGYLGPGTNTFGYQALSKFFSGRGFRNVEAVPFPSHDKVCLAVGNMDVDYGVVAVENVIDGVVAETIRAIESVDSHLGIKVWGEVILPIELFLMNKSGNEASIKKLLSHQTAIGQCRKLVSQLQERGIPIEVQSSTSRGAEIAVVDSSVAALASRVALKSFKLKLVHKDSVTDYENSRTRFWILGKEHAKLEKKGDGEIVATKFKTCFLANLSKQHLGCFIRL